jgi:hypothetical protein
MVRLGKLHQVLTIASVIVICISSSVLVNRYILTTWGTTIAHLLPSEVTTRMQSVNKGNAVVFVVCLNYSYDVNEISYLGYDCSALGRFSTRFDAVSASDELLRKLNGMVEIRYDVEKPQVSIVEYGSRMQSVWICFWASCLFLIAQVIIGSRRKDGKGQGKGVNRVKRVKRTGSKGSNAKYKDPV